MISYRPLSLLISWFVATTSLTFFIFFSLNNKQQIEAVVQAETLRPQKSNALQDVSCCDQKSEQAVKRNLVIISTLDGHLTVLDALNNGKSLWSLKTDALPLFSSTIGNLHFFNDDNSFRLIPSLDGNFYMYDDAIARGVPISAETLLSNSMKLGSDVISGGKEIRTMGVDLESGKVLYSYALNSRENFSNLPDDNSTSNLIIKRTTRVVRAVEATTGQERWNVTVGEYELLIPKNELSDSNRCVCPLNRQESKNREPEDFTTLNAQLEYRVSPADGLIVAYDKSNPYEPVWTQQLTSPIAQLWSADGNGLNELSLFNPQVVPYLQVDNAQKTSVSNIRGSDMVLYIGTYQNEKYVIPSPEERRKLQTFVFTHQYMPSDASRLYLAANAFDLNLKQPAIIEDENDEEQCSENLPTCSSRDVNSLILKDHYSRDMGWYLFKQNDKQATKRLWYAEKFNFAKFNTSRKAFFNAGLSSWWHLWLFIILPTSFIACAIPFFVRKLRHFDIQVVDVNEKPKETTGAITASSSANTIVRPLEEAKIDSQQNYESWYLNHFDPIRCLGKGGFGIVIESLNKLDQQIYAVKRISVSNKPDGKERVQREVRALATLDHPGIVRYFNSWLEEPPCDWQETWDKNFVDKSTKYCPQSSGDFLTTNLKSSLMTTENNNIVVAKNSRPYKNLKDDLTNMMDEKILGGDFAATRKISIASQTSGDCTSSIPETNNFSRKFNLSAVDTVDTSLEIVFEHNEEPKDEGDHNDNGFKVKKPNLALKLLKSEGAGAETNTKETTKSKKSSKQRTYLFIQMQLCDQTLRDWLRNHSLSQDDRPRDLILDWFDQIVCAVQYVHDCGLIHRDLKPSNIFLAPNGQVKIGDFGLAKRYISEMDSEQSTPNEMENSAMAPVLAMSRVSSHTDNVGTWLYMSPEQEKGDSYTLKIDIYALGLIFVEMLVPFGTEMERRKVLSDLKLKDTKFPQNFSVEFPVERDLIQRMIIHDADQRLDCKQIREFSLFEPFWSFRPRAATTASRSARISRISGGSRESCSSSTSG